MIRAPNKHSTSGRTYPEKFGHEIADDIRLVANGNSQNRLGLCKNCDRLCLVVTRISLKEKINFR